MSECASRQLGRLRLAWVDSFDSEPAAAFLGFGKHADVQRAIQKGFFEQMRRAAERHGEQRPYTKYMDDVTRALSDTDADLTALPHTNSRSTYQEAVDRAEFANTYADALQREVREASPKQRAELLRKIADEAKKAETLYAQWLAKYRATQKREDCAKQDPAKNYACSLDKDVLTTKNWASRLRAIVAAAAAAAS